MQRMVTIRDHVMARDERLVKRARRWDRFHAVVLVGVAVLCEALAMGAGVMALWSMFAGKGA